MVTSVFSAADPCSAFTSNTHTHLKYIPVQKYHYYARNVEAAQRREDDEVTVVEHAQVLGARRCAVQAQHDRRADGHRDRPHQQYGYADALAVPMPGIFDWLRDGDVAAGRRMGNQRHAHCIGFTVQDLPVYRDGHQIKYGRRRTNHVHGYVVVAHELGQRPLTVVDLRHRENMDNYGGLMFAFFKFFSRSFEFNSKYCKTSVIIPFFT